MWRPNYQANLLKYKNVKSYKYKISCVKYLGVKSRFLTTLFKIIKSILFFTLAL
jgi:hypothetical protein